MRVTWLVCRWPSSLFRQTKTNDERDVKFAWIGRTDYKHRTNRKPDEGPGKDTRIYHFRHVLYFIFGTVPQLVPDDGRDRPTAHDSDNHGPNDTHSNFRKLERDAVRSNDCPNLGTTGPHGGERACPTRHVGSHTCPGKTFYCFLQPTMRTSARRRRVYPPNCPREMT